MGELLDAHSHEFFLPSGASVSVAAAMDSLLLRYTWLAKQSDEQGVVLFPSRPKLHFSWHIARKAGCMHPRRVACWCDESSLSLVKSIAASSAVGTPLHCIP
eukprot:1062803-Pyramimonas_sp.AAC.1